MAKKLLLKVFTFWALLLTSAIGWGQCIDTAPTLTISNTTGSSSLCKDGTTTDSPITFTSNVSPANAAKAYQWQVQIGNGSWSDISNATTSTLSYTNPALGSNRIRLQITYCLNSDPVQDVTVTSTPSGIITVYEKKQGTVTISANKNNICPGENISISASPLNHGASPTYRWEVNGQQQSTSSSFSSTTFEDGDIVKLFMTSSAPCVEPFESDALTINVKDAVPDQPGTISTNFTGDICPNSPATFSISEVDRATSYQWTLPSGWTGETTGTSVNITTGAPGDGKVVKVKAINDCGQSTEEILSVNVGPGKPATPSAIESPSLICPGEEITLSVTNDPALDYTWDVPTGWTIKAGQGSNEITVTAGNHNQSGTVSVYATNDCLDSDTRTKSITINDPIPGTPGTINGSDVVCPDSNVTYSISAVQHADSYIWTYDGAELQGQTGTSVTFSSGDSGEKDLTVIGVNECGESVTPRSMTITVDDGTPDDISITSPVEDDEFCPQTANLVFSVPSDSKADDGYTWSVPDGWTINNGQGSNEIIVTSGNLDDDGNITVTAKSDHCGEVSASIAVTVKNPAPSTDGKTIDGPKNVCASDTGVVFEIPEIDYATEYIWEVPGNWNILSGENTNRITVDAGTDDIVISVYTKNECGDSGDPLEIVVTSTDEAPDAPGVIESTTDFTNNPNVCPPYEGMHFEIDPVDGATEYEWKVPAGWSVTNNNELGTSVTINASATNDYNDTEVVQVRAGNGCYWSEFTSSFAINIDDYIITDLGADKTLCKSLDRVQINANVLFGNSKFTPTLTATGRAANAGFENLPGNNGVSGPFTFQYTPLQADLDRGSVTIKMTVPRPNGKNACGTGEDEMTIFFRNEPQAEIAITGEEDICYNSSSEITFTGDSENSLANAIITYTVNDGDDLTIQLDDSGIATLPTGNLTENTTYDLVSIAYPDSPECSATLSGSVTVEVVPDAVASFSYENTSFCTDQTEKTFAPKFSAESTGAYEGGSYSVDKDGLSIDNDGVINPAASTAGSYVITYSIPDPLSCGYNDQPVTTEVTILQAVEVIEVTINEQDLCEGESAEFTATATGDIESFQWYTGTVGSGTKISGATSQTFSINAVSASDSGTYYVEAIGTSPCSSDFSEEITLNVYKEITISDEPDDKEICEGGSVIFSVTASAGEDEPLTFQWQKDGSDLTDGTNISGSTTAELTLDNLDLGDEGEYRVLINGSGDYSCSEVISSSASLEVKETPVAAISGSTDICEDMSTEISFSGTPNTIVTIALPNGSTETVNLDSSGSGSYITGALPLNGNDAEDLIFSMQSIAYAEDPVCTTSLENLDDNSVTITVNPTPTANVSFANEQVTFCNGLDADGKPITYIPELTGSGAYENGVFSGVGFDVDDSTTGAFTPADLAPGNYSLVYTMSANGGCEEQLASLDIIIYNNVQITSEPFPVAACTANSTQLEMAASGDDLIYQWFKVGENSDSEVGTDSPILQLNNVTAATEGEYYVVVSGNNACEPAVSQTVYVTVDQNIIIEEDDQPVSQNICIDDEATLRVAATASGESNAIQYQWQYRATSQDSWSEVGTVQTGAEFSEFAASEAGEYRARIEGPEGYSCDIGYSAIATISVYDIPTADAGDEIVEVCSTTSPINIGTGASISEGAVGKWTTNGAGEIENDTNVTGATYIPTAAEFGKEIEFYLTASLDVEGLENCADTNSSDTKTISIIHQPEITAFSFTSDSTATTAEYCETDEDSYSPLHLILNHNEGQGEYTVQSNGEETPLDVDSETGEFTPNGTTPGTYIITYTFTATSNSEVCTTDSEDFTVIIGEKPIADFSYEDTPFCSDASNPLPLMAENGIKGSFSSTPEGLKFVDTSTGEVDIAASTPGTYEVINTIAAAEGCAKVEAKAPITINQKPAAPGVADIAYCHNEEGATPLTAIFDEENGAVLNWYATEDADTALEDVIMPNTANLETKSYWVSQTSAAGCESERSKIVVTINELPEVGISVDESIAESDEGNPVICFESEIVLLGTGATEYFWSTDEEDLGSGLTITVSPGTTTTYYVTGTDDNGCSDTSEITIEVNPITDPGELSAPASVCIENPAGELVLTNYTGEILKWEYQEEGATEWSTLNDGSTDEVQNFSELTRTTTFRATLKSGVCDVDTIETTVTIDPLPEGGKLIFEDLVTDDNDGTYFMICEGATTGYLPITLPLAEVEGTIVGWRYLSGTGSWQTVGGAENPFTGNVLSDDQIKGLNLTATTVFRVEIQSGNCVPNAFSETAIVSVIPSEIRPEPVTVDKDVVCLGETVTLSSLTNYTNEIPNINDGTFDNAGIKNNGWRFLLDGNPANFETNANNRNDDFWSRATPHDFNTANYNTSPYSTTPQRWAPGNEEGNKGFAIVSGPQTNATMETNIFSIGAMDQAIVTFDQAYNLTPDATITVEISEDGGVNYTKVLFTRSGSASSGNYASFGNTTSKNNKMVLDLGEYLGQDDLRIRFSYTGTRTGDIWAVDAIEVPHGPRNIGIDWNDYTNPGNIIHIGTTNSVTYEPKQIGLNTFEVKTKLIFDSTGNACSTVENAETISVFVFDKYTTSVTAETGSCGDFHAKLTATVLDGRNEEVTNYPTPDGYIGKWNVPEGTTLIDSDPADEIDAINDPNAILSTTEAGTYGVSWILEATEKDDNGDLYMNPNACPPVVNPLDVVIEGCIALDFDGENDRIFIEDPYAGVVSIEAWIRPERAGGTIISGPNFHITTPSDVTPNSRWYHIAVSNGKLYVDGIEKGDMDLGNADGPGTSIGAEIVNGEPTNFFEGWIEEVRLWNKALTVEQIRFMMNQRLIANGSQMGEQIPMEVPDGLTYSNLAGYYRLISAEPEPLAVSPVDYLAEDMPANGLTPDRADTKVPGRLINMETNQQNTAPLPYYSGNDGAWGTDATWLRPDVWDPPHTGSIEWNIVRTSHDITSGSRDIKLLGLISEVNTLDMEGTNPVNSWITGGTGNQLYLSHYLLLDGIIDLNGESQLLQPEGSIVRQSDGIDRDLTGYLDRDQQGTASSFNYNYWSSPVSPGLDNAAYSVEAVMMDGTNEIPVGLSFGAPYAFADGTASTPRKVSTYWLHRFHGTANNYFQWDWIGAKEPLLVGEGYSMKGTDGTADIENSQNYTFRGIPNNGSIDMPEIKSNENYLVGNPYPSAISAEQFIKDNIGTSIENSPFNGTIYFWDHFAEQTHYLEEYVGGYAALTMAGSVSAAQSTDSRINDNLEWGNKKPGPYISVGQGFFINTVISYKDDGDPETPLEIISTKGGFLNFNNGQRAFEMEGTASSVFHSQERKEIASGTNNNSSQKVEQNKIWLKFKSPKGYHRQILVTADERATDNFDLGFDAPMIDNNVEDMYWYFNDYQFVIQGVPDFDIERVLDLGINVEEKGTLNISIDDLENIPDEFNIYLADSLKQVVHDLRVDPYETESEAGTFTDRFKLVFQDKTQIEEPEVPVIEEGPFEVLYVTGTRNVLVRNPELLKVDRIYLNNMLGQQVHVYYDVPEEPEVELPVKRFSAGVYIVKVHYEGGIITKKVILE